MYEFQAGIVTSSFSVRTRKPNMPKPSGILFSENVKEICPAFN